MSHVDRSRRFTGYWHAAWPASLIALLLLTAVMAVGGCGTQTRDAQTSKAKEWNVRIVNSRGEATELRVPVARTDGEMEKGLSGLSQLPGDGGMLFVFADEVRTPFWMKDTLVPLSIAFLDATGRIVDIQDMEPMTETLHYSARRYQYALEMNKGFFESHAIRTGDVATLKLDLPG